VRTAPAQTLGEAETNPPTWQHRKTEGAGAACNRCDAGACRTLHVATPPTEMKMPTPTA